MSHIKTNLLIFLLLYTIGEIFAQDLPSFVGTKHQFEYENEWKKPITGIELTYKGNFYSINGKTISNSATDLGDEICKSLSELKYIGETQLRYLTIELSIDKRTSMSVVDSILNEMEAFNRLLVTFKTNHSDSSGFHYRQLRLNKDRVQSFSNNKIYYPPLKNLKTCVFGLREVYVANRGLDDDLNMMEIPPPPPSVRYVFPYEIVSKYPLDSLIGRSKYYTISKQGKTWKINNEKGSEKKIATLIEKHLRENRSVFLIDFTSENSYDEYLHLFDVVCKITYDLRDEYIRNQQAIHLRRDGWINEYRIKNEAKEMYPLAIRNYSITDKLHVSLLEEK